MIAIDDASLTIGQLARRFGLNPSAIRYYEASGVLPEPAREHGQRRYGPDAIRRLEILAIAKRAGFSLRDAGALLHDRERGAPPSEVLRELAARRLADVDSLIASAHAMRDWLLAADDCSCTRFDLCPLFADDHDLTAC